MVGGKKWCDVPALITYIVVAQAWASSKNRRNKNKDLFITSSNIILSYYYL